MTAPPTEVPPGARDARAARDVLLALALKALLLSALYLLFFGPSRRPAADAAATAAALTGHTTQEASR